MLEHEPSTGRKTSWAIGWILSIVVAFSIGAVISHPGDTFAAASKLLPASPKILGIGSGVPEDLSTPVDFKEFWDLWRQLKTRYNQQPVDDAKLFYGAMSGMAAALGDPYTVYFEPKSANEFAQSLQGKFEGIGAEIAIKDDQLQVVAPLPDTPAARAGLRPGDFIFAIDKQDTAGMSVEKAVSLIRGKGGTTVTLSIGRVKTEKDTKGKEKKTLSTQDLVITRAVIVVKSVKTKFLRDGIAKIDITHFNEDTATGFEQAVTEVLKKNPKGLIIDLRNNPGGFLDRATDVASAWVGNEVVVMERQQNKITDTYRGKASARLRNMPTVILVNQGSASASEIVAGALQDYGKAKLVGMKTFGKGSVQDFSEFTDKSAVKITIAEWLTPKGRSINTVGIQPDIQVDQTLEDFNANRDPQLDRALQILTGKPATTSEAVSSGTSNGTKK